MVLIPRLMLASFGLLAVAALPACARTTATAKNDMAAHSAMGSAVSVPPIEKPTAPQQDGSVSGLRRFQDAFFDYEKALIREDAKRSLQEDALLLKRHPEWIITIGGYCDERGTDEYNLVLGNHRAEAVRRYLIALGVNAAQLRTISYGKEKPFCREQTEVCYQLNRRGQLIADENHP